MSQAFALYRLQKVDSEIDMRRQRAAAIAKQLEQDSALREAIAAVETIEAELRPRQARAAELNLELQTVTTQAAQLSDQLYGGSVTNPKELADIQGKIAERNRRHAHLENLLLEVMIEQEDLQAALATATARLEQVRQEHASAHGSLTDELARIEAELMQLKEDRKAAAREITPENRELYKRLRALHQGQAVALLQDDICSGCGVSQTTTIVQRVRQGQELVRCGSCGRLLVAL